MFNSLLGFIAGVGIFIYGAHLLSKGLQQLAVSKLRLYMTSFTNTRLKGFISGIIITFFLQSSTVTSIIVVGLVGSSVLSMTQALSVVLGSAVGTTITVQVLAFDISKYSAFFILSGAILYLFIRGSKVKMIGQILIGLGFVFFGIGFISSSLEPLSHIPAALHFLTWLATRPLLFAFVCIVLTAALHNSAAMIMIGLSFVTHGVFTLDQVIPLVIGANVGATIPVFISSLSSSDEGKKVAFSLFVFKFAGFVLCLILLPWLSRWIYLLPGGAAREVANFHTVFNIVTGAIFLPFLEPMARLIHRLFPTRKTEPAIRLSESLLDVPEEALIKTEGEILKLGHDVRDHMIRQLGSYLEGSLDFDSIYRVEKRIDEGYQVIQKYLLKLGQQDLSTAQSNQEVKLLYILNDIESIGDTVIQFMSLIDKARKENIELGGHDRALLERFIAHIDAALSQSIEALEQEDSRIAMKNIQSEPVVSQFEMDLKFNHFNRLIDKNEYNPSISAIYLDIVNQLLRVYQHSLNISRTVLGLI
ncbi:Na/Pi cotransporter family protein [Camelliibacillus cellulosilyticus]|uniref:Na/Pi cotransporter family protein n=1 Tax=Camelliibacillus cellulosilyticus TaxID=2174486 RepID=A0ABV9GJP6_9BACL